MARPTVNDVADGVIDAWHADATLNGFIPATRDEAGRVYAGRMAERKGCPYAVLTVTEGQGEPTSGPTGILRWDVAVDAYFVGPAPANLLAAIGAIFHPGKVAVPNAVLTLSVRRLPGAAVTVTGERAGDQTAYGDINKASVAFRVAAQAEHGEGG